MKRIASFLITVMLCAPAAYADGWTWDSGYKGDVPDAADVQTNTTLFGVNLGATDTDVQKALDTLDDLATVGASVDLASEVTGVLPIANGGTASTTAAAARTALGAVGGPASSTDNALARWDGTGGTTLQDSAVTVADTSGNMTFPDNAWIGLGSAAGRLEFDDQATDEVNILDANVGIGTTSPAVLLHLVSATSPIFRLEDTSAGGKTISLTQGGNLSLIEGGGFYFDVNGDTTGNALVMPTGGGVGIDDLTPDASLEVVNDGSGDSFLVADTNDGDTTPFVIQADGDVGIGTASPSAKLHSLATTEQLRLGYDASNYISMTVNATSVFTIANQGTGGMVFDIPSSVFRPTGDTSMSLGDGTHRWSTIYAASLSGPIMDNIVRQTFGGSNDQRFALYFYGGLNSTGAVNDYDIAQLRVPGDGGAINIGAGKSGYGTWVTGTFQKNASGNHPLIAAARFDAPTIYANASTITDAATVYISGAPNETVSGGNYSLYVNGSMNSVFYEGEIVSWEDEQVFS